jgi:TRAP-type C4-dicarboxylate transport system permease small subunit
VLACGWWLLVLVALTCVEVVGRKLAAFSLQGVQEIGGYTLAAGSALAFAYTELRRGHTRIDFALARLPATVRAVLNTVALLALAAMAAFATVRGFAIVAQSIEMKATSSSPLQTPLWIPQSLWLAGWALLALLALAQAVDALRLLVADRAALNHRYDPPTLAEEIRAELGHSTPEAAK